jgi:hypothetical protein
MLAKLARLVRGRKAATLAHLPVVVYCREECGCCHKALELLRSYQDRHGFPIEVVDVDSDPALAERHGLFVPVVEIAGKVRFKGKVNPVLLERILDAEGRAD